MTYAEQDDAERFIQKHLKSAAWEGERLVVSFDNEELIHALVEETVVQNLRSCVMAIAPFRAALRSLFCCECGRKFDQANGWEECTTHQRIRDLLRGETQ